ncbi:hypothetical protein [Desulfobulbus propionicus]|jgi:hypothetical protein
MKGEWPNNFRGGLLLGCLIPLLALLLMGAVHSDRPSLPVAVLDSGPDRPVPLSSSGRYQLVTWEAGGHYGAFVLDTATGVTKVAYSSGKGPGGRSINNIGKSFSQM